MSVEVLHCPSCGAVVSSSARLCGYCGSALEIVSNPTGFDVAPKEPSSDPDRPLAHDPSWVIVASFVHINDWHSAAGVLNHANIVAREVDDPNDPDASGLAVFSSESETAHQVLAEWRGRGASAKPPTGK
jgi:hypothetical protein